MVSTSAPQAARRIIEACRYGDPRLIITFPAKLLHLADALCPGLTAFATGLAARLLPAPALPTDHRLYSGKESGSRLAPSLLTRASDRASRANNEE